MDKIKKDDNLNESNFQIFAQKAVEKYMEKGMILDGMLWGRIIKYYNKAIYKSLTPEEAGEIIRKPLKGFDSYCKLIINRFLVETFKSKEFTAKSEKDK